MEKQSYQHLLGKSKNQIKKEMEEEFNFFPSDVWTYILDTSWFGRKRVLVILFSNDAVKKVFIKKIYGKIKINDWIDKLNQ
jgi:hypothetical protein